MTFYSVSNPFPQILSLTGTGLNDGDVYFGVAGQDPLTHPKTVYWDLAGTQVADQPIPTTGGYLYRSLSPANVYLNSTYSIKVLDKNGDQVYYQANVYDPVFQIEAELLAFEASLAASGGSALVGYNYGTANSVNRTIAAKAKDRVSIQDWGAVGGTVGTDATRIQRALDECPLGETLHFPPVSYSIDAPGTPGTAGLTLSRQINLACSKTRFVGFFGADVTSNLFNIKISQAVYGAGDVRRTDIFGLETFFATGGNDVLYIENQSPMASNLHMYFSRCGFGGNATNGVAVHVKNTLTQLHTFSECAIDNQAFLDGCADSCHFFRNLMGGTRPAFRLRLASGAFNTVIDENTIVTRDGALIIENGSQVFFTRNQCEQLGANLGAYNATVALDASDPVTPLQIKRVFIEGNNFGGGGNVATSIIASTGGFGLGISDVFCDKNTFSATTLADIRLLDSGVQEFKFGDNNYCRGNRGGAVITDPPGSVSVNTLDQADLFVIFDLGRGTYGLRKLGATVTFANGWVADAFSYRKGMDDILNFGGAVDAGTLAAGTLMFTMPVGFRTPFLVNFTVCTNNGTGVLQAGTDGTVKVVSLPVGTTTVYLADVNYRVQGHATYNPGV